MPETNESAPYRWSADHDYLTLPGLSDPSTVHLFGGRSLVSAADLSGVRSVVKVRQVHGRDVVQIDDRILSGMPEGDALMTDRPDILITIETADCTPILLFDPARPAVAAIHAGWRGTVANIVAATVRAMTAAYGSNPRTMRAGIGPTIGPCCYEVGREVWDRVEQGFSYGQMAVHPPDQAFSTKDQDDPSDKAHLDLVRLNTLQLIEAGLPPTQVVASGLCTACERDHFYSYRRDAGRVGRHVSGILLKRPGTS